MAFLNRSGILPCRMGTIVVGKEASFNVLDANPLESITNTRRISTIYLRGKELNRPALRASFMPRLASWPA